MPNGGAAAGAAAAAAAIAKAIKASGVIVRLTPEDFRNLAGHAHDALAVHSKSRWFGTSHKYLLAFKGFAFYAKSKEPISLPGGVALIEAEKIWVPD
jgi:hypothetical protein